MQQPRYLILGEVLRPHGVRGEMRVRLLTDYPERIATLEQVFIGRSPDARQIQPYAIEHMRMHQGYGLLKLRGIDDRDSAERLRSLLLMIDFENAVPLEEGEFYLFQVIGVEVETTDGRGIGKVTDVLETGANDVYIVNGELGEILIPAIETVVKSVDTTARRMIVDPPPGLIPGFGEDETDSDSNSE